MKAKLVSFDGAVLTLQPATGASFSVSVLPDTRYVGSDRAPFAGIKAGDYAGAAVEPRGAALRATDVYLYAPQLRGTGEGRFPDGGRLMVNGTVTAVAPATPKDGVLTLHYHGAVLNQAGKGATVCEGRATPAPYASAMACEADAVIAVAPGTPVSALTVGDKSLLVPGATVTVAMTRLPDGKSVTPGVVVEKPQSPQ
ncbi:MAG TPA: hypothetical protein VGC16_01565 [Rhizomicrobium sp.]